MFRLMILPLGYGDRVDAMGSSQFGIRRVVRQDFQNHLEAKGGTIGIRAFGQGISSISGRKYHIST